MPHDTVSALRGIAEDTGGDAVVNTNSFSSGFERIVNANSSYYLLGYRPAREYRDGRFHAITVRVRRPGLAVRARRGYFAPGAPPPELAATASAAPAAALIDPLPSNGLELGVRVAYICVAID